MRFPPAYPTASRELVCSVVPCVSQQEHKGLLFQFFNLCKSPPLPTLLVVPVIDEFISHHCFICKVTTGNQLDACALWVKHSQGETRVHPCQCQQLPPRKISQKDGGAGPRGLPGSLTVRGLCLLRAHGESGCPFTSTAAAFASQD